MPSEPIILLDLAPAPPLTPPPRATEPAPPPDFRPEATAAFDEMVKAAGTTVYRMPTSAGLYVRQYLGSFEQERDAVLEALRRGVPERIAQFPSRDGFRQFLSEEADKLAADAGLAPGLARGAVECWAAGVGRRLGPPPPPTAAEVKQEQKAVSDRKLRTAMTGIAAFGGFVGGFFGNVFVPLALLYSFEAVDATDADYQGPGAVKVAVAVVLFFFAVMGGLAGALGAALGWVLGRGDERPWVTAWAAAGAAFITGSIASVRGPKLAAFALMLAAFGAAYRSAASGGFRK